MSSSSSAASAPSTTIERAERLVSEARALGDAEHVRMMESMSSAIKLVQQLREHDGVWPTMVVTREEPLRVVLSWDNPPLRVEVGDGQCRRLDADALVEGAAVEDHAEIALLVDQALQRRDA